MIIKFILLIFSIACFICWLIHTIKFTKRIRAAVSTVTQPFSESIDDKEAEANNLCLDRSEYKGVMDSIASVNSISLKYPVRRTGCEHKLV